jgi:hypothetical protein
VAVLDEPHDTIHKITSTLVLHRSGRIIKKHDRFMFIRIKL